jgi:hypothetical protein
MNLQTDDERDLERLIDGELPFAEQRALLDRLEILPDGWRKLALGLLEEHAFRREFSDSAFGVGSSAFGNEQALERSLPFPNAECRIPNAERPRRASRADWMRPLPLVAASLICVVLGMQVEQYRHRSVDASAPSSPRVTHAAAQINPVESTAEEISEEPVSALLALADKPLAQNQRTMKIVFSDWPSPVEMPVLETTEDEASEFLEQSAVTAEMRQEWESAGYLIYENRKYVPVPLGDGREGIAPISDIVVEYVGTDELFEEAEPEYQ